MSLSLRSKKLAEVKAATCALSKVSILKIFLYLLIGKKNFITIFVPSVKGCAGFLLNVGTVTEH